MKLFNFISTLVDDMLKNGNNKIDIRYNGLLRDEIRLYFNKKHSVYYGVKFDYNNDTTLTVISRLLSVLNVCRKRDVVNLYVNSFETGYTTVDGEKVLQVFFEEW